jgi:hypothetical protein
VLLALTIRAELSLALNIRATIMHTTIILVYTALMRRVRPPAGGAPSGLLMYIPLYMYDYIRH